MAGFTHGEVMGHKGKFAKVIIDDSGLAAVGGISLGNSSMLFRP
jgi:hypothetical protein